MAPRRKVWDEVKDGDVVIRSTVQFGNYTLIVHRYAAL